MHRTSPTALADLLPAAFIAAIFAGFVTYVFVGQQSLILCFLAAAVGGLAGVIFACGGDENDNRETVQHRD